MTFRFLWACAIVTGTLLCLLIAHRVPSEEGGLVPAGVLLLALGAILLRRRTLPRSDRPA